MDRSRPRRLLCAQEPFTKAVVRGRLAVARMRTFAQMPAADGSKLCNLVRNSYRVTVNGCRKASQFLIDDPARISSI